MPIVAIIVVLILVGVALYLINMIPMEGWIKTIIRVLMILFVVLWLLQVLGLLGALSQPMPHIR